MWRISRFSIFFFINLTVSDESIDLKLHDIFGVHKFKFSMSCYIYQPFITNAGYRDCNHERVEMTVHQIRSIPPPFAHATFNIWLKRSNQPPSPAWCKTKVLKELEMSMLDFFTVIVITIYIIQSLLYFCLYNRGDDLYIFLFFISGFD